MKTDCFDEFGKFVAKVLLPATKDVGKLADTNRKHVQKLVYTNLVDRFDAMVGEAILENCRKEHLVKEAMKGMTQPVTEADVLRLLMEGQSIQDAIDVRLKDVLSIAVLRQRHSKKLATLFKVLKPDEECWNKPRVNTATGQIFEQMTSHRRRFRTRCAGMLIGCTPAEIRLSTALEQPSYSQTISNRLSHSSSANLPRQSKLSSHRSRMPPRFIKVL
jgi:hypothetical protein